MKKKRQAFSKTKIGIFPSPSQVRAFRKKIYAYYAEHGRNLPWRKTRNPYRILLSEIMLQQTQVERVLVKYKEFLSIFPDFDTLARAPLARLLAAWSGLGYNRRALALRALARKIVDEHNGKLPSELRDLRALPGIGKYTSGALLAFVFNKPATFLDTNIRRVYINEFFDDDTKVHDDELIPLIEKTMDTESPGKWYNALMDYGSMLKRKQSNPNRRSAHYKRQLPFKNSDRQIRGAVLKVLLKERCLSPAEIIKKTGMDPERTRNNLTRLANEGFIRKERKFFRI